MYILGSSVSYLRYNYPLQRMELGLYIDSAWQEVHSYNGFAISPDQWYHIIGQFHNNSLTLTIDGVSGDSVVAEGGIELAGPITIGSDWSLTMDSEFDGYIDQLLIIN